MFILYSVLLTVAFVILFPRFLHDVMRRGKYAAGFRQRLGRLPAFDAEGKPVIWLHCVSVGETQAARPLVDELLKDFPGHKLVISTTTRTGQEVAQNLFADKAALIFYFPFDWKFAVRRALKTINPQVVLLMETELWFNFLRVAHKSNVKIAIVNGRLSDRSVNRYMWIRKFMIRVLYYVDLALMQSQQDGNRIKELGMKNSRIRVTGNIKFDQPVDEQENLLTGDFRKRFGIADSRLIVAASTHDPEEKWLLEAFSAIKNSSENSKVRLMIVPRHPERFSEVAELVSSNGFTSVRRSAEPGIADELADVILLDSIGELRAVFPLAEIVFVGGSLIPHGGQNILEPAAAHKAIITGPYTANFAAIVSEFLEKDALIQLPVLGKAEMTDKLQAAIIELLQKPEVGRKLADKAFSIMQANAGAAEKTVKYLAPLLDGRANTP
ncbi:MAG TPA: 3-deoxy-D-manno-octulosonic acid transferase [Pyrinomonadaceae bacterium]|jgi:3-deoxy-D-manno-octulosonic-acid transferase|nr:3-deoxy-D-manno-octulosonic acid transferase [Pyrinomonadaceae bacterium]